MSYENINYSNKCAKCGTELSLETSCLLEKITELMDKLSAAHKTNDRLAIDLTREKEEVAYLEGRREKNSAVIKSVWEQHEEQFKEQEKDITELKIQIESLKNPWPNYDPNDNNDGDYMYM